MAKCEDIAYYMSLYLDNELSDIEKETFEAHLEQCEECRKEFEEFKLLFGEVRNLPEYELPQGYHEEVMGKLRNRAGLRNRFSQFSLKQFVPAAASAAGVFVLLSAVLNSVNIDTGIEYQTETAVESRSMAMPYTGEYAEDSDEIAVEPYNIESAKEFADENFEVNVSEIEESLTISDSAGSSVLAGSRLTVEDDGYIYEGKYKSCYIDIQVGDMESIKEYIKQLPGTVIHEYGSLNYASITKAVDSKEYEQAIEEIKQLGDATYVSSSVNDYRSTQEDLEMRITALANERENLLQLMERAENVGDIVQIQQRIYTVEEQINWRNNELENYKNRERNPEIVINISLSVKKEEVQKSLSQKIKESFVGSVNQTSNAMENLIVGAAFMIIPAFIVALLYGVISIGRKYFIRKKNRGDLHEKK